MYVRRNDDEPVADPGFPIGDHAPIGGGVWISNMSTFW